MDSIVVTKKRRVNIFLFEPNIILPRNIEKIISYFDLNKITSSLYCVILKDGKGREIIYNIFAKDHCFIKNEQIPLAEKINDTIIAFCDSNNIPLVSS